MPVSDILKYPPDPHASLRHPQTFPRSLDFFRLPHILWLSHIILRHSQIFLDFPRSLDFLRLPSDPHISLRLSPHSQDILRHSPHSQDILKHSPDPHIIVDFPQILRHSNIILRLCQVFFRSSDFLQILKYPTDPLTFPRFSGFLRLS
jgi:hypothetical protein